MSAMQFRIKGKLYDAEAGLRKVTLLTLFELKSRHGIGMKQLAATAKKFEAITDPMELLEDEEAFKLFLVVIWLARKHAGENMTLEEANNDFSLDEMALIVPDDEAVAPAPKAPTDSVPAVLPAMPAAPPSI